MSEIKKSAKGIDYVAPKILKAKVQAYCKALLIKIPHASDKKDIGLKIGRYQKKRDWSDIEMLATYDPKSELTLDNDELESLIQYLNDHYTPLSVGERTYIPLSVPVSEKFVNMIRSMVERTDSERIVSLIVEQDLLPEQILSGLQWHQRKKAVEEFEKMLGDDLLEGEWQKWFQKNDWVLGSDCVRIVDERSIDVENIADFLVEGYDGFLDVIELKRPGGHLTFWHKTKGHDNWIPSQYLTEAITQCQTYLYEVEREMDSTKFLDRVGVKVVKPRAVLVFGRSNDWDDEKKEAFRVLNRSYHSLTILTYDHVLARAKRILGEGSKHSCP